MKIARIKADSQKPETLAAPHRYILFYIKLAYLLIDRTIHILLNRSTMPGKICVRVQSLVGKIAYRAGLLGVKITITRRDKRGNIRVIRSDFLPGHEVNREPYVSTPILIATKRLPASVVGPSGLEKCPPYEKTPLLP